MVLVVVVTVLVLDVVLVRVLVLEVLVVRDVDVVDVVVVIVVVDEVSVGLLLFMISTTGAAETKPFRDTFLAPCFAKRPGTA